MMKLVVIRLVGKPKIRWMDIVENIQENVGRDLPWIEGYCRTIAGG